MAQTTAEMSHAGPSRPRATHDDLHHLSPEIIVIGAGIAGTALSYALSHSGRQVLLLERDLSEPDRIVGELLQPGGVNALSKLGLEGVLEGIDATPVEGYTITQGSGGEKRVVCPYPALDAMVGEENEEGKRDRVIVEHEIQRNTRTRTDELHPQSNGVEKHGNGIDNGHTNGTNGSNGTVRHRKPTNGDVSTDGHSNGHPAANGITTATVNRWHVESASGRKEGRSFHHGRLITSLRRRCIEDAPNLTVLEATVRSLIYCDHSEQVIGVTAAFKIRRPTSESAGTGAGEPVETVVKNVYAPITIIADGCFSKFRTVKGSRLPTPKLRSHFVGVILHDIDLPVPHNGTVCLSPAGPVLLYQIGYRARETRMLVDVKEPLPSNANGGLKQFIIDNYLPYLPPNLHQAVHDALNTQAIRRMPNSFLPPSMQGLSSATSLRGAIMVGDAYNMRHPLTGGGMTVAFNDAVILSEMLAPGGRLGLKEGREGLEDWDKVAEGLREWFWERKHLAGVVNVLSMALYDLFGGSDYPEFGILQAGCFKYLGLGGDRVAGPVGLLSAITPKPLILFYHFFAVAFYSLWILFKEGRPPSSGQDVVKRPGLLDIPGLIVLSIKTFWTACVVLLPVIWTEFRI